MQSYIVENWDGKQFRIQTENTKQEGQSKEKARLEK